jgi:hypothetical protein
VPHPSSGRYLGLRRRPSASARGWLVRRRWCARERCPARRARRSAASRGRPGLGSSGTAPRGSGAARWRGGAGAPRRPRLDAPVRGVAGGDEREQLLGAGAAAPAGDPAEAALKLEQLAPAPDRVEPDLPQRHPDPAAESRPRRRARRPRATRAQPPIGGSSAQGIRTVVVLPAPLGAERPYTSACDAHGMSRTASIAPQGAPRTAPRRSRDRPVAARSCSLVGASRRLIGGPSCERHSARRGNRLRPLASHQDWGEPACEAGWCSQRTPPTQRRGRDGRGVATLWL